MSALECSPPTHKCVFCNQQFFTKLDLQNHFRRHANGEIDIKGQPKVQQSTNEKLDVRDDNKSLEATDDRGSGSATNSKKGHTAVCDVCGENFHTVSLAISHKFRKHPESVIKHYCPHCGMMFPIKLNRDKHLLTHPGTAPKQLFPCLTCGVAFYNQRARKFHMTSAHKGEVVQCNLCSALFYSKRAYEAHNHHHRESDMFAANEEMRQQVVHRIDQDFDQRRVPSTLERYLSASAMRLNRSATWRNIRAARRTQVTEKPHFPSETLLCKDNIPPKMSCAETSSNMEIGNQVEASLEVKSPLLSASGLGMGDSEEIPKGFDEKPEKRTIDKGVDTFIQDENMCWELEERVGAKKRIMNYPEEDDCDISSLGTVNPDSVMSNPRVIIGEGSTSDTILGKSDEQIKDKNYVQNENSDKNETKRGQGSLCTDFQLEGKDSNGSDTGELVV
ncbi:uncharacterized protein [Cherax quadricarinatus]|uniref:uncharacterized protein isoform X3 n=1 Tax=Cherax quadricarinatus TaxID=27406 RepID=UPI0023781285|nr:zinc finger protein 425-like isoform X1 [Cherax quadricarinatus]